MLNNRMLHRTAVLAAWAAFSAVSLPAGAQSRIEAVTKPKEDLKLGFAVGGKLTEVGVEDGDHVKEGDVLMSLDDEARQAVVELYSLRANSDIPLKAAKARLKLAEIELKRARDANAKGAASQIEVNRAEAQVTVDGLNVLQAELNGAEAAAELRREEALHDQYVLKAPLGGIVEQVAVSKGEVVEALKPIMRLVVIDPISVDAPVPTEESIRLKVGDPAWVTSQLPGFEKTIQGKIVHMASEADAGSQTRLVRVEVPNKDLIPAGVHVYVSFTKPENVNATAAKAD